MELRRLILDPTMRIAVAVWIAALLRDRAIHPVVVERLPLSSARA
jgi:hypothetical protein